MALWSGGISPAAASAPSARFPMKGAVEGFRLSGVEPDGDPLYQALLSNQLGPAGGQPAVRIIIDTYLENFKPDTTPVLPDLLHPHRTAQNLGGFLSGKSVLTDDGGHILSVGTFIAEAFLDNSNHAIIHFPEGTDLRGTFWLKHSGAVTGAFTGRLELTAREREQILAHRGQKMRALQKIIAAITVKPHYMMGRATTPSSSQPLRTGFSSGGKRGASTPGSVTSSSHPISIWTIVSAIGAMLSLLMAGVLFWSERRRKQQQPSG
jgi:hypothetical protein